MEEYIKKSTLLERFGRNNITKVTTFADGESIYDTIKNFPAADVEEVKHGYWIDDEKTIATVSGVEMKALVGYRCSRCGRPEFIRELYCNCGAKMDGGD